MPSLPFGTWPSPITAASVAAQSLRLSAITVDGDDIYWLEGRPADAGRNVLVRRTADGVLQDVTPSPFNVRTRVHEYGGGAFLVDRGTVWFVNFADQCVYRMTGADGGAGAGPTAPARLTPAGPWCYADFGVDRHRRRLIAVREDHSRAGSEPVTTLAAIAEDGSVTVIAEGRDFYSTPRVSPDGRRLLWLCWDHPQMPWDGTELWTAAIRADGSLASPARLAGGPSESIYQPGWLTDGTIVCASDRTGWWQLHLVEVDSGATRPVLTHAPDASEFGRAQWTFATSTWTPAGDGSLVVSYAVEGIWHLGCVDRHEGALRPLAPGLEPQEWLAATDSHALVLAASPRRAPALVRIALADGQVDVLKESSGAPLDDGYLSVPEAIAFPGSGGQTAHAFYYRPRNRDAVAGDPVTGGPVAGGPVAGGLQASVRQGGDPVAGGPVAGGLQASAPPSAYQLSTPERPPIIAISHGGPTSAASRALDMRIQFWTSRGFAVVDVNYGGSTGYGRAYRERLRGTWGHVDVDDMIGAVTYLAEAGAVDPRRAIIRGGSAGGYTTLAALTFHPGVFQAGASYYGVSDLEVLARDTHKFEARYLDSLVGPYPAMQDEYRARSPIHAIDRLSCALILFQGLEDRVVPPNQSALMADAVRQKGLPVAYVAYEGEQHGFRKADNIARSLEAELYLYGAVFGFAVADRLDPVAIDNL